MEDQSLCLRIITCQRCHEHINIDPHEQIDFIRVFNDIKNRLAEENIKIIKNVPFRYLQKVSSTKYSTKRYINSCTNKIVEFPQRGAFQLYFQNIFIYSKLEIRKIPHPQTMYNIVIALKKIYKNEPMLSQFQQYKNVELDWNYNANPQSCLFGSLSAYLPTNTQDLYSLQQIQNVLNFIHPTRVKQKNKILPYSFYGHKQRRKCIEKIYCPNRDQLNKKQLNISRSNSKVVKNQNQQQTESRSILKTFRKHRIRKCNVVDTCALQNNVDYQQLFNNIKLGKEPINQRIKRPTFENINTKRDSRYNFTQNKLYITYPRQTKTSTEFKKNIKVSNISSNSRSSRLSKGTSSIPQKRISSIKSNNDLIEMNKQRKLVSLLKSSPIYFNKCKNDNSSQNEQISSKKYMRVSSSKNKSSFRQKSNFMLQSQKQNKLEEQNSFCIPLNSSFVQREELSQKQNSQKTIKNEIIIQQHYDDPMLLSACTQNNKRALQELKHSNRIILNFEKQQAELQLQSYCCAEQYKESEQNIQHQFPKLIEKFSEHKNFEINFFKQIYTNKQCPYANFQLTNELIYNQNKILKLDKIYDLNKLKIFPKIFRQIQHQNSLLAQVVNTIIKNNPQILIRNFENKSEINIKGNYCIWLHTQEELFKPIIIDDQFLVDQQNNPIYAAKDHDNAIWFMLLQKAVAKVYGSYQKIKQLTLNDLFRTLLGCPTIQLKSFTPQNLQKILVQKLFFSKKAAIYTLSSPQNGQQKLKIERIIGFQYNKLIPLRSLINFQTSTSKVSSITLQDFIIEYNFITLVFFNLNYFYNQVKLPKILSGQKLLTLQVNVNENKTICFFSLGKFHKEIKSKIIIYRYVHPSEKKQIQNEDPFQQADQKYQYVGQISRKGSYFFQTILDKGKYLVLIETNLNIHQESVFLTYSEHPVQIQNIIVFNDLQSSKIFKPSFIEDKQNNMSINKQQDSNTKFSNSLLMISKKQKQSNNLPLSYYCNRSKMKKRGNKHFIMGKKFQDDDLEDNEDVSVNSKNMGRIFY